ncbi:ABC transporter substrate-binding protein [Bdellovibrio sp. KM01]|uniref:substrate-binding periplasmic protein n=1 Tax=Bdellovibrio sp. KM01 TaxID=2748865 RepID=UPI0015E97FE7|nr:transporter substrate-binding domain-containing protein [Bdellovibrio sp. KM01]QLY26645.1 transporter substrate-binding domain-containing protein [Bdellovibrio sp. KM01]
MKFIFLFLVFFSLSSPARELLRVAAVQGPPHVVNAEANPPQGSGPDFMVKYIFPELKKKFKINVVWKSSPFKRELRDLENNQIDVLFFIVKTPEREKIFDYSAEPFISEHAGIIVHKDFHKGKNSASMSDFAGKTVGLMAGASMPPEFKQYKIKTITLSGVDLGERLSNLVETNRIDGVFVHLSSVTREMVETNKYPNLKSIEITDIPMYKVYVAFSKKLSPEIKNEIDSLLKANRKYYRAKN